MILMWPLSRTIPSAATENMMIIFDESLHLIEKCLHS